VTQVELSERIARLDALIARHQARRRKYRAMRRGITNQYVLAVQNILRMHQPNTASDVLDWMDSCGYRFAAGETRHIRQKRLYALMKNQPLLFRHTTRGWVVRDG